MVYVEPGRTDSNASHSSNREIETIVEEFTGELSPGARTPTSTESTSTALTPRSKSSLAKKLAKSLGFSSSKASDSSITKSIVGGDKRPVDSTQQSDRNVHFGGESQTAAVQDTVAPTSAMPAAVLKATPGNTGLSQEPKYVSPFQNAQETAVRGDSSLFYSPSASFVSVISSRPSKAMSSTLEEEASQARKSPLGITSVPTRSGELDTKRGRLALLDSASGDKRSASGGLDTKSRRSSLTYSVKSSGTLSVQMLFIMLIVACCHVVCKKDAPCSWFAKPYRHHWNSMTVVFALVKLHHGN